MIELNEIFSDSDTRIALWCDGVNDTNDLAIFADYIISHGVNLVSVPPELVSYLWTCLEKEKVKIFTRFDFLPVNKDIDKDMDKLSESITSICKKGADGVQVFLKMRDFYKFTDVLSVVRDDLFFDRDLSLGMDIEDLEINDFENIFRKLREIRATSFVLTLNEDMGNRSDFVGRVYGMLKNWDMDGELHMALGNNYDRIDQVIRLVECERPDLNNRVKFFLDY